MTARERKARQLEARKQRIIAALPPLTEMLRGSLFERRITCGKAACRCAQGPGHPTTYLSVSFKNGQTVQITVPKTLVPRVRELVDNYSAWWAALEQVSEINRQLLRTRLLQAGPP